MRGTGLARTVALAALAMALTGAARPVAAQDLPERLDRIFGRAGLAGAEIGVAVVKLADGRVLYERNAEAPLALASNMKLVTTAAALDRLGLDYRFETYVLRRGEVAGDVLDGDLIVRGGGDPCLGERFDGTQDGALARLARAVREAGIRRVTGALVADDRFLDREHRHPDWPKDQADRWYEAPVSALVLNDGCVDVTVAPGARPGLPAVVTVAPAAASSIEVENRCVTTGERREHVVDVGRRPGANRIVVRGAILARGDPVTVSVSVVEPALLLAAVLRARLAREGVAVAGPDRLALADEPGGVPLAVHASLLAQALPVVNKRSQNLYAELVLKVLGRARGKEGSWKGGLDVVSGFLGGIGVPEGSFELADGSGLARGNRLGARSVARVLEAMARRGDASASAYVASLSVAGVDGTLRSRLSSAGLRGRVRAKTGTIRAVSALSGYVFAAEGAGAPAIAFSILMNDLRHGPQVAREAQDDAVEAIVAELDRAGAPAGGAGGAGARPASRGPESRDAGARFAPRGAQSDPHGPNAADAR